MDNALYSDPLGLQRGAFFQNSTSFESFRMIEYTNTHDDLTTLSKSSQKVLTTPF